MGAFRNVRVVLVLTALFVGVAVWGASHILRADADRARARQSDAQLLLTGMLDQETGMRGYLLTGVPQFLGPYNAGRREYFRAVNRLRGRKLSSTLQRELDAADAVSRQWRLLAASAITRARTVPASRRSVTAATRRKVIMDRFRQQQKQVSATVESERQDSAREAGLEVAGVSIIVALLVGLLGDVVLGRRDRRARRAAESEHLYRATQGEFAESMQLVRSEDEAHQLLKRHLERTVGNCSVAVLNSNNSADRLEPTTRIDDAALAQRLEGAAPDSCSAVRLGRTYARPPDSDPLMTCEICGATGPATTCRPLVVGSEVIGSVLVVHEVSLEDEERSRLNDSVVQAAPVLANLRNLAIAETRAATDALTGLPNRRSIDDTLKRMVAQASRNVAPLSALLLDLDHFKKINDRHGHEMGDEALAAVGALLADALRESDFAGRLGGEEFLVLAPATDVEGGAVLAENLRNAVRRIEVPGVEEPLSVSIGVATYPDAAADGATLLRMADRALYAAKERGRDRVEVAARMRAESGASEDAQAGEPRYER